jgi:sulfhydrogenase subunit alpha
MHTTNLDMSIEDISKIEGHASVEILIRNGQILQCEFAIAEMRRFFMQAIRGKPMSAVPGQVARICGTCSNAHILASLKAIEMAIGYTPTPQVALLRQLLNYGLIIRDHALHLYLFVLPDLFNRDSILEFAEDNPVEHQLIHDCFDVKQVGNELAIAVGGRSVHAPIPRIGGFLKLPTKAELTACIPKLQSIRVPVLRLIETFAKCGWKLERDLQFVALVDKDFSFLDGTVKTSDGSQYQPAEYLSKLNSFFIPYSEATGYRFNNMTYMVGALARLNLNRDALHQATKRDAAEAIKLFPSKNIYHNNLAQAIEILHAIDASIDLIGKYEALTEPAPDIKPKAGTGIGIIEAPRGMLYHQVAIDGAGLVTEGHVIVPTGQNQIGIEEAIRDYLNADMDKPKEVLTHEIEKIIRAYDPCMSCASHFLKIRWNG